jgi:type VI secretion system protein ImpL
MTFFSKWTHHAAVPSGFLLLGPTGAGKKTLLKQLRLDDLKMDILGKASSDFIQPLSGVECHLFKNHVFFLPESLQGDTAESAKKTLISLLHQKRKLQSLNGVLIVFNVIKLMGKNDKERQAFIRDSSAFLRDLFHPFKSQIPLYLIVNQCDRIEGFIEFFNAIHPSELEQAFGISFPIGSCHDLSAVKNYFSRIFPGLIQNLRQRVVWLFDRVTVLRSRELIYAFPQQFQQLQMFVEQMLNEIFTSMNDASGLQLRGVYFTSCLQKKGHAHNGLLPILHRQFGLTLKPVYYPMSMDKTYFLKPLFHTLIFREAPFLGKTVTRLNRKRFLSIQSNPIVLGCILNQYQSNGSPSISFQIYSEIIRKITIR